MSVLARFARDDRGQDLLEYALLSALVGVAAILTLNALGVRMADVYSAWNTAVNNLWELPPPG